EGKSDGYVGLMFLGAQDPSGDKIPRPVQLRNYRFFSGRATFEQGGDPSTDDERYQILNGTAPKSLLPKDPQTGFRPEVTAKKKDDYRMVVSAGRNPLDPNDRTFATIEPGDTLGFQAALVIGRGFDGMVDNAIQAQLTFDGAWLDCDGDPRTGVDGRETRLCPDPFMGQSFPINKGDSLCFNMPGPMCNVTIGASECQYINADCDLEAESGENTGVDGKECLIHWLIGLPPPPPNMRLISTENEVDILFDNRSEMTPDLRLQVIDFESYRIWRADNWTRPFGTDVNTGPGGELWALLAEYDLPNNHIGSDTGLDAIRYNPAVPDRLVQFYREWFKAHPFLPPPKVPGFSESQQDTATAMARGVRYYRFVDPPFVKGGATSGPCGSGTKCAPIQTDRGPVNTRCNKSGVCQETAPPPHSGA